MTPNNRITVFLSLLFLATSALADDWHRYENSHFVVFSDAPKKKVTRLLVELEEFRSAFLQISRITIPSDAPKNKVFILDSIREYRELAPPNAAAFALPQKDHTIMVSTANNQGLSADTLLRHEFGHALLRYNEGHGTSYYPHWIEEGFSELASAIEIDRKEGVIVVGELIERADNGFSTVIDWDKVVRTDFDPHDEARRGAGNVAYAQAWLLTHYAMLGDQGRNANKLNQYMAFLRQDRPSAEAFETAFGIKPENLWTDALRLYVRDLPVYHIQFKAVDFEPDFARSRAEPGDYEPALHFFRVRWVARRDKSPIKAAIPALSGTWDFPDIDGKCGSPKRLAVDQEAKALSIQDFGEGDEAAPVATTVLNFTTEDNRHYIAEAVQDPFNLARIASVLNPGQLRLFMPNETTLCIDGSIRGDAFCRMMLERCGS